MENNASHKGINIIGSTCILNDFLTVNDVYPKPKPITSLEIKSHLEHLIELNPYKEVVVFLDNARTHTDILIQQFYQEQKYKLELIFLPKK